MKQGFVCVIDSGIGGLAVLKELVKARPNERYLYFGDNLNAPYGNLSRRRLWEITMFNLVYLTQFDIKVLVVGCNTLSVNFINEISSFLGVKTFGVYPPVESALVNGLKPLLIATCSTAKRYEKVKGLSVFGLKKLASDIEEYKFNLKSLPLENLGFEKFDHNCLILGCTHYELIKNRFLSHFCPPKILQGSTFTAKLVSKYLSSIKSLEKPKEFSLLFVGECAYENKLFWDKVVKRL